jgi:hypothetical protein
MAEVDYWSVDVPNGKTIWEAFFDTMTGKLVDVKRPDKPLTHPQIKQYIEAEKTDNQEDGA